MLRTGSWDDALTGLTQLSGSEQWKITQELESTVDVPLVLSPSGVCQQQIRRFIHAIQRQKDGLRSLAKTRARSSI